MNNEVLWEKKLISSKLQINTEHGIFHYEMVLRAENDLKSVSRVKLCPVTVEKDGELYDFFLNPVDKVCLDKKHRVVVNWKDGMFVNPVCAIQELSYEEQLAKHLVLIENFIETEYLKEIYLAIENPSL